MEENRSADPIAGRSGLDEGDLSEGWRVYLSSPGTLKSVTGKMLGFDDYGEEIFYRAGISGVDIIDIWQPGHPEYDVHTGLGDW